MSENWISMKLLAIGTLAMAAGLLAQNSAPSAGSQRLYVLHDPGKDVWCGYADASRWRKDIDSLMALEVLDVGYAEPGWRGALPKKGDEGSSRRRETDRKI
jgi:hypothetical protein